MKAFFASTDWAVVWATLVGPILAVLVTLWAQERSNARGRKEALVRQFILTRKLMGDPAFSLAINMVPVEFRHHPRVYEAWQAFVHAAGETPITKNLQTLLDDLLKEMLHVLGFREKTGQVLRNNYQSNAMGENLELQRQALEAVVRVANAAERSAAASETLVAGVSAQKH